jgi:DNA-binding transcriptional regulator YdaS (Cro superfamily)
MPVFHLGAHGVRVVAAAVRLLSLLPPRISTGAHGVRVVAAAVRLLSLLPPTPRISTGAHGVRVVAAAVRLFSLLPPRISTGAHGVRAVAAAVRLFSLLPPMISTGAHGVRVVAAAVRLLSLLSPRISTLNLACARLARIYNQSGRCAATFFLRIIISNAYVVPWCQQHKLASEAAQSRLHVAGKSARQRTRNCLAVFRVFFT